MALRIFPFTNKKNNNKILLPNDNIKKRFTDISIDKTYEYDTYYLTDDKNILKKIENDEYGIRKLREIVKDLSIKGVSLYNKEELQKLLIDYYKNK